MECPVCQAEHQAMVMSTPRLKVVFSSSTLGGFYKADNWNGTDGYHIDVETIGGAKIMFGKMMWQNIYNDLAFNIDTHCVYGLNDVLQLSRMPDIPNITAEEQTARKVNIFMERVESWYEATKKHRLNHNLETPNRFSFSSILRPPQLYSLPGNSYQDWPTFNGLIDNINTAIDQFNVRVRTENREILGGEGSFPVTVRMCNLGMRSRRGKMTHNLKLWREDEASQKLHLVPNEMASAMTRVTKFFKLNTPNAPSQYFTN